MLDKQVVSDVLAAALSTGGHFAEIFVENNERHTITMINGVVEEAGQGIDYGCGIRIFDGLGAIYAYTNHTTRDNLIRVAKEAAAVVSNRKAERVAPRQFADLRFEPRHPVKLSPNDVAKADVVQKLRIAANSAGAYHQSITQTIAGYGAYVQDVLIANSDGLWATDRRVRTRVNLSAVASSENEKQTATAGPGAHRGFELFDALDMQEIGESCAHIAVTMLGANLCPSGKMPVVIDDGFGGVIFHEACGHSLEATSVAKNASVFAQKLGQSIASPIVTAIDDGTLANEWGSQNIDDEGTPMQRNILIENGILKSFLVDRLNGLKMGSPSTGSSRRGSYKFAPTSRMTNTFIAPGKDKAEDIIRDTEYGLYAKKMGGGSVMPATGEFNFAVTEAYMIRNGQIAEPVRGATLIGKGHEVLLDIDRVSDRLRQEQGMCGSISGQVPTNVGQPMIRVKELTVGGRR